MAKCVNLDCGHDNPEGSKFCLECGKSIPLTSHCSTCGKELPQAAKFCLECGSPVGMATARKPLSGKAVDIGEKNVIAGDVIGSKEEVKVQGNASFYKVEDDQKKILSCQVCGKNTPYSEGFTCPVCGKFVCVPHYDPEARACSPCAREGQKSIEREFIALLEQAYADGKVDLVERRQLEAVRTRLNIRPERAAELESRYGSARMKNGPGLTKIEQHKLEKARSLLMEEYRLKDALEEIVGLYEAHPNDESILSLYLMIQKDMDPDGTLKLIEGLNADVKEAYLAAIDIMMHDNRLDDAEKRLDRAKSLWGEDGLIACKEVELLLRLSMATEKKSYMEEAEKLCKKNPESDDARNSSELRFIRSLIGKVNGEGEALLNGMRTCVDAGLYPYPFMRHVAIAFPDYENVDIATLKEAAEIGSADAQKCLGNRYSEGHDVPQDFEQAVGWYRRAADQGYAKAQNNLATSYLNGEGVEKDEAQAVAWYRKAADQDNANAQCNLGWMFQYGRGVPKDDVQAASWYLKAAEQGDITAQYSLGTMYQRGWGVPQDEAQAAIWYHKAADQGNASAQFALGVSYENGIGVLKNDAQAAAWYLKAADQADADAQYCLGILYQKGIGVPQNDTQAVTWYRKAAENGNANAQGSLGCLYREGRGVPKDLAQAVSWFQKAADQEDAFSQFVLGDMYEKGQGVIVDYNQAIKWISKSAVNGYAKAQYKMGVYLENGKYIKQDTLQAINWYRKAAEQGIAVAQKTLAVIYEQGEYVKKDEAQAAFWGKNTQNARIEGGSCSFETLFKGNNWS